MLIFLESPGVLAVERANYSLSRYSLTRNIYFFIWMENLFFWKAERQRLESRFGVLLISLCSLGLQWGCENYRVDQLKEMTWDTESNFFFFKS